MGSQELEKEVLDNLKIYYKEEFFFPTEYKVSLCILKQNFKIQVSTDSVLSNRTGKWVEEKVQ